MTDTPLVTIAIPAYNSERFLPQGLDSVRNQTYSNLEIIIADDGSTDATGELCDQLAAQDQRIKVLHLPHQGAGAARNALIENATGDFIYFCDIDDRIEPNLVEVNLNALEEESLDVSLFGFVVEQIATGMKDPVLPKGKRVMRSGEEFRQYFCDELVYTEYGFGYVHSKFFRMSILRPLFDQGIKFEHIPMHEDEIFLLKIFPHITRACTIPLPFYHYIFYPKGNTVSTYKPDDTTYSVMLYHHRMALYDQWIKDDDKILNIFKEQLLRATSFILMRQDYYSQSGMTSRQHYKKISSTLALPEVRECAACCSIKLCEHPNSLFSKIMDWSFYHNHPAIFLLARNARDLYRKIAKKSH